MQFYEEKKRLNITVPVKLYNLLERDSIMYGMSKSTIVQNAIARYYRDELPPVSSGKESPSGGDDTP